ncbi:MAG TPA: hypothetical protein VKT49_09480 [Bryobacteraceae bacterium]|nr:hypothetical protein [Bryobacteraceae bacterium]
MKRIFRTLLRLYPAGHREVLGEEMLFVFEQAAEEQRARGRLTFARFILVEIISMLWEAAAVWKWHRSDDALDLRKMRPPQVSRQRYVTAIDEVLAARQLVAVNLARMQEAIARREFVKARFYSDEERKSREHLRLIHRKYRIDD